MLTIVLIIVLTAVNALFAASEMALVSIKPSTMYRIQQSNRRNSHILKKVTKDSTKYLSTIQVAITFSGFLSSAFAGSQLSSGLVALFSKMNIALSNGAAVIIITVLLSFFTLVFGELVPKRVALSKSISIALFAAPVIYVFMKVFTPFVWLLTASTRAVVRMFGIKQQNEADTITEKEIKEMIAYGHIEGLYQEQEKNMMERIFLFDDVTVGKILTPMEDVTWIDIDLVNEELIDKIIASKFSRIPVYQGEKHNLQGVILVKDILDQMYHNEDHRVELRDVIRPPFIVPSTTKINALFKQMKKEKYHLSFIEDEQKKVVGIVTLEDIIEEIVGDIYDEHDK